MKLFRYTMGTDEKYGVSADHEAAYNQRGKVDSNYEYLPVAIEEVTVPDYEIILKPTTDKPSADEVERWESDELRSYLDKIEVEHKPQWNTKKLREAVLNA